jgi:hypothetical protein
VNAGLLTSDAKAGLLANWVNVGLLTSEAKARLFTRPCKSCLWAATFLKLLALEELLDRNRSGTRRGNVALLNLAIAVDLALADGALGGPHAGGRPKVRKVDSRGGGHNSGADQNTELQLMVRSGRHISYIGCLAVSQKGKCADAAPGRAARRSL